MRYQPKFKNKVRSGMHPYVERKIAESVERDAIRWNASRSWIISTALAAFYDIDIVEPYEVKQIKKVR